ncbi:malonic semialdehyde reductase [Herminiimonas aquatilis]|uniref:Putative NADH dehydrogenase/NAD(P)H nitroreductase ACFQO0_10475 n=1 Tax=Herminiimonas aquatilis TaxID=345342 RepID=A0ABW2J6G9_9BURK
MTMLNQKALDTLFTKAHTNTVWLDKPVTNGQLREIYELMKWAPTSMNCSPTRIAFVKSPEAKEKLAACVSAGNVQKVKTAPITAIIGMDMAFPRKLPQLFPHMDGQAVFAGNDKLIEETAFRNSSLQGAYFIMAARAIGLDCGPMSGFDADKVNAAFFVGTQVKANFLCSIGYGDHEKIKPRLPRLTFEASCAIVL